MARRSILLLIAVLIAAIGTTLIVLYVRGIDERAQEGQDLVEVLVASEQIDTGETMDQALEEGKVEQRLIAQDALAEGALGSTETLEGLVALSPIFPGEEIVQSRFGEPGEQQSLPIPEGLMAISVELTDPARVAGFVANGATVAIFVSADPVELTPTGEKKLPSVTRLLLPQVQVLGTGSTTTSTVTKTEDEEETTEEISSAILTIAVDQEQAEKVIYADRNGDLSFALLTDDSDVEDGAGVEANDVLPESFR